MARPDDPDWVDQTPVDSWDPWGPGGTGGEAPPPAGETVDSLWAEVGGSAEERGLNRTLGEWLEGVVPIEAQLHFYNAGREFAAGVQVTLEHHLRRGAEDGDRPGGPRSATTIDIE